jgi:hypothetical protein
MHQAGPFKHAAVTSDIINHAVALQGSRRVVNQQASSLLQHE